MLNMTISFKLIVNTQTKIFLRFPFFDENTIKVVLTLQNISN